ncbi:hypothetical protein [Streptomyces sp. NPDC051567]|uniref:hypothetical protein n=1 Tax=Streptomyces sp. NPDC051567 TaxID=3365660 RepID=UPI00378A8BC6
MSRRAHAADGCREQHEELDVSFFPLGFAPDRPEPPFPGPLHLVYPTGRGAPLTWAVHGPSADRTVKGTLPGTSSGHPAALAGSTASAVRWASRAQVHPRVRGEHQELTCSVTWVVVRFYLLSPIWT